MAELERTFLTARDLSQSVRISEKEVAGHLEHVAQSLKPPKRLLTDPAVCHGCGFVFSDRRRFSNPGRCPRCRHEGIRPPAFRILQDP